MKHVLSCIILVVCLLPGVDAFSAPKPVNLGVVFDGPDTRQQAFFTSTLSEVTALTERDATVSALDKHRVEGNHDPKVIQAGLERLLADPDVDIVITIGPLSSHLAASLETPPAKPVFAPFILDPKIQGLPSDKGTSGVKNLNYLCVPYGLERAFADTRQLFAPKHIALVLDPDVTTFAPMLPGVAGALAAPYGAKVTVVPMDADLTKTLEAIPEGVDTVMLTALGAISDEDEAKLIEALTERRYRTFAFLAPYLVELGAVAGARPGRYVELLRRRIALNIQRVLTGEDAGTFPTTFDAGATRVQLDMRAAGRVGWNPSWSVLLDAEIVRAPDTEDLRHVDLDGALVQARDRSLEVKAALLQRDAGNEEIRLARARLLPSVDVGVSTRVIDADRAANGFGLNPQYLGSAAIQGSQVIFSEAARTGRDVQVILQQDRDAQLEALTLDVLSSTATAYLDVLRTRSLVRVRRANLEITRQNLELAIVRERVGASSRADVLRFQSEIAQAKKDLIDAFVLQRQTEIQLNRLLNYPEQERFTVDEANESDQDILARFGQLAEFLQNRQRLEVISDFLAKEASDQAPELERLDAAITSQERVLLLAKRSFFLPDVALNAQLSTLFLRAGEGAEAPELPGGLTIGSGTPDDFNWEVSVVASYSIFSGMSRRGEFDQAELDLARLGTERRSIEQQIHQRLRSALLDAVSSYTSIELSRQQADAARQSLEIVAQSYSAGAVDITSLIDAQRASVNADAGVVNAVYDFMGDIVRVERALGVFHTFAEPGDRAEFARRMRAFYEERTANPTTPTTSEDTP